MIFILNILPVLAKATSNVTLLVDIIGAPWWVAATLTLATMFGTAIGRVWGWISGRTKRQLDEVAILVKMAKTQALEISELVQANTTLAKINGDLQQSLDSLTNSIEDLQKALLKEQTLTKQLRNEIAKLREQMTKFTLSQKP